MTKTYKRAQEELTEKIKRAELLNGDKITREEHWKLSITIAKSQQMIWDAVFTLIENSKEGSNKNAWSPTKTILFQGLVTLVIFLAGWFFSEIAPRIFTIPPP